MKSGCECEAAQDSEGLKIEGRLDSSQVTVLAMDVDKAVIQQHSNRCANMLNLQS